MYRGTINVCTMKIENKSINHDQILLIELFERMMKKNLYTLEEDKIQSGKLFLS